MSNGKTAIKSRSRRTPLAFYPKQIVRPPRALVSQGDYTVAIYGPRNTPIAVAFGHSRQICLRNAILLGARARPNTIVAK